MINVRTSKERRHIQNEHQDTWMTFDWKNHADPLKDGFGALKTLNENILLPDQELMTFQMKKDMLILTYVREGKIIYKGQWEKHGLLAQNEFQLMNVSSEMKEYGFNASHSDNAHVFQSGFVLNGNDLEPGEIKKLYSLAERQGVLKLIASSDGKEDSLSLRQDVQMYSSRLAKGNHIVHELKSGRRAWLHVVKGQILMNDLKLQTGDGVGITEEKSISFTAQEPTSILIFDLA